MAGTESNEFVLGIDLGTNSLGWAMVRLVDGEPAGLIRAGARVFDAGMDDTKGPGNEESRNKARRDARLHRRQLWRHRRRLVKLAHLLQRFAALPDGNVSDSEERQDFFNRLDAQILCSNWFEAKAKSGLYPDPSHAMPYILRAAALDEALEPHFLGRALYHLAQRRGFLSNRKQAPKKDKEEGVVKEGIADLRKAMQGSKARTLGEYLSHLAPSEERIRARWTHRDMYEEEFKAVWNAQANHHPRLLTEDRKKELYRAIFYQRPLWFDPNTIGQCDLEPGRARAAMHLLISQRFRLLQKVNDLQIEKPGDLPRYLTPEERANLADALELRGDLTFKKVRDLLGLPKTISFNLQRGGEDRMPGNRTTSQFYAVFGERWLKMCAEEHDLAIQDVLSIQKSATLMRRGMNHWKLGEKAAEEFSRITLEPDYMNLSRQAMEKLLPLMETGTPYAEARKEVYHDSFEAGEPIPFLPAVQDEISRKAIGEIRNPGVMRSLTELRKVTNAIVREYGRPLEIRIELARDLKKSRTQRQDISEANRRNEKARANAASEMAADPGISDPKPVDIRKFLLAEECHWQCPYTGKSISRNALFGPEPQFDIEHIIPFSRSMDNSFQNLTLCYVPENRNVKGNKSPHQAYSGDDEHYQAILDRVKRFTGERWTVAAKLKRFMMDDDELEAFLEDFRNRQLNDTAYASLIAKKYLGLLYGGEIDKQKRRRVFARSGRATSDFRSLWQLNSILDDGPTTKGGRDEKKRTDHRHHAVDAVVIGLASDSMIQRLSKAAQVAPGLRRRLFGPLDAPWQNFVDTLRAEIRLVIASHRVSKKVSGALHEETIYSRPFPVAAVSDRRPQSARDGCEHAAAATVRVRKPLALLTKSEVEDIADPLVRFLVERKLSELGVDDPKKAFADENKLPFFAARDGRRIPIKRVRVKKQVPTYVLGEGRSARHVTSESNHHVEIYAQLDSQGNEEGWDGDVVSMFEAYQRQKARKPVVQRNHGLLVSFKFSLGPGEVIECDGKTGERSLFVMRKASQLSSGQLQIGFAPINDARKAKEMQTSRAWLWANPVTLSQRHPRKVIVNALGEVSEAHD